MDFLKIVKTRMVSDKLGIFMDKKISNIIVKEEEINKLP
jgi:hypothetical protein